MFRDLGALDEINLFELSKDDDLIRPPTHGPYGSVVDKKTGKTHTVCLCTFCGKKAFTNGLGQRKMQE
jgi:hypothetical protein